MKTIWQIGRDVFARPLRRFVLVASRVRENTPRALAAFALAGTMLLASLGGAHAQTATTTQLISAPNPSPAGEDVTFSATVVPAAPGAQSPSGTVTFLDNGTAIGTGTLNPNGSDSVATFTTATLPSGTLSVGTHMITTSYLGDSNFSGSSGGPLSQVINKNDTKTLILASPNPSTTGQQVAFDVVISPVTPTVSTVFPTGTVQVFDNGSLIATATLSSPGENSSATFVTTFTSTGTHNITMSYAGDANFNGNTNGTLSQQVNPPVAVDTSVTVAASPATINFGQSVTFTATITPASGTTAPGGTVTFSDGITTLGSAPVSQVGTTNVSTASITTTTLPVGSLTITAGYSGNSTFNPSSGTTPFTVAKAGTNISIMLPGGPVTFGQAATFTATVNPNSGSATPTGTATFSVNGGPGTPVNLNGGKASFTSSTLPVGNDTITVTYGGDGNFSGSSNSAVQRIDMAGSTVMLTSSQNPSALGQSVTFTATVSGPGGTPTGMVNFTIDGGSAISKTLSGGITTLSTSALGAGSHAIVATYLGDSNFSGSATSLNQDVKLGATTTTLASSVNPSTPGQSVTFTATVTPGGGATQTPTGFVVFQDGSTVIGKGDVGAGGVATLATAALTFGCHNITASYHGDGNFAGSTSAPLIQQVGAPLDSTRLRELQISATPIIANLWGQAVTGAMDEAVSAGFGGNPQSLSPAGTGFTYYFTDDAPAQPQNASGDESLRRYLTSPNGSANSAAANSAAATDSVKRVDDDFRTLGYAGGMPTKAPPPAATVGTPRDWLAWINVRGTDYFRGTFGNDLKGEQVDAFAGLTRRISANFVVGHSPATSISITRPKRSTARSRAMVGPPAPISDGSSRRICASTPAAPGRIFLPMAFLEASAATSSARAGSSMAA